MSIGKLLAVVVVLTHVAVLSPQKSFGQAFGVELQASLMPAAGGMGGVGIARPQDVQTSLALNPATLTQMKGTKFSFGGAWAEPTISLDNDATIGAAGISPFNAKSKRPGSIVGNIGVTQDYTAKGLPVTVGMGLLTASGLGVNYRDALASNGSTAEFVVLGTAVGIGAELTDRLSIGVQGIVASASMDGVFTGISASTPDYNLRAALGLTYQLSNATTLGAYWHTKQKHTFNDFVRFGGPGTPFQDFSISLPNKYGVGIANQSLMNGRLLLAVDLMYFEWSETDFFGGIWEDQLAVQTGAQYTTENGCKLRLGYAYAENASRNTVAPTIGGIMPQSSVDYIQALFPNINQHRISGGIGLTDLLPGVDVDLFAGGMFENSQNFGESTVTAKGYWVGFGTTWRFGRGGCKHVSAPNQW